MSVLHTITVAALTECCSAQGFDDRGNRMGLSTYDKLPAFLNSHHQEIIEGAWVCDLTPLANHENLFKLSWNCPMPDLNLVADEIHRWDPEGSWFAPLIAGNYFGVMGAIAAATKTTDAPGPYDYVSPEVWASYWHSHGGRVGRYHAGVIDWLDAHA